MSEWRTYAVGEVAEVFDGPHATPAKTDTGPWFLSISSLASGRLDLSESAHLSEDDFARWTRRVTPSAGDVLFSYETRLGEAAMMPEGIRAALGRRMGLLRPRHDVVEPRFLLLAYLAPEFQQVIRERKIHGATVDRIPLVDLPQWPVRIPDLDTQRHISSLLGALNDKIAINDRIAECSLALADAHFSLAVEGVPIGPETFSSVAQIGGGATPSTKVPEYWGGDIAWTTPSDVTALSAPYLFDTSRKITDAGLNNCASALYAAGSIFMTSRATIGAFAIPQLPAAVNQGFIVVVTPDKDLRIWLFHEMRDRVDEMHSLANGSTFLELSRKNFKAMGVRLPAPAVVKAFAGKAIALHERAAAATAENAALIGLRDTLLPELMLGRLQVKHAEKVVEETVEAI